MVCTKGAVEEHLSDDKVYKRLTRGEIAGQFEGVSTRVESFVNRHQDKLSKPEYQFLKRGIKRDRKKLARFYVTAKTHKPKPRPYTPIVATCGTVLAILSKRLDHKL